MRQSFVRFPPLFACAAIAAGASVPTELLAQDRPRGEWDVTLPSNKTLTSVLKKAGTIDYYCRFHPNMKATLVVAP